jgi:hypothetical protein
MSDYRKGYDRVIEMPKYDNVKTRQCQEQRKRLGTEEISKGISNIVFLEDILRVANNSSILRIDNTDDDSGKMILVFSWKGWNIYSESKLTIFYGTFNIVQGNSPSFIAYT